MGFVIRELGKELSSVIQEQLLVFHADLRAGGLPQGSSAEFPLTAVTTKYHKEKGLAIVYRNPSMVINRRTVRTVSNYPRMLAQSTFTSRERVIGPFP